MMKLFSVTKLPAASRRIACVALSLGALLLAACGWHLQGVARLPASMLKMRIESVDTYSDFYRELRQHLLASGAQLDMPARDAAVVRVQLDQTGQRVLSISARNTPEEYEVFYTIEYSVEIADVAVQPLQRLELTANYSFDPAAVLAKDKEKVVMQRALARELAGLVLRRLGSVNVDNGTATHKQAQTALPVAR